MFTHAHNFINLSRADPSLLHVRRAHNAQSSQALMTELGGPWICLSVCACKDSKLTSLEPAPGKKGDQVWKYIHGIFHTVEWERFCAAVGMAWGVRSMQAPLTANAITFSTRCAPADGKFMCLFHRMLLLTSFILKNR
jgi:hypothetical protein